MADFTDILSNEEEQVNNDELMKYLEGKLSEEEKNAFERKSADSSFMNDAVEGLQQFENKRKLDEYVAQLNKNLHDQLGARKLRKERKKLKDNPWVLLSVIIILALCLLAYLVIHTYYHNKANRPVKLTSSVAESLKI